MASSAAASLDPEGVGVFRKIVTTWAARSFEGAWHSNTEPTKSPVYVTHIVPHVRVGNPQPGFVAVTFDSPKRHLLWDEFETSNPGYFITW